MVTSNSVTKCAEILKALERYKSKIKVKACPLSALVTKLNITSLT